MDTYTTVRGPSVPEILADSFAKGRHSLHDLERIASLHGHDSMSIEMAVAKAERAGLLVRETVYRLAGEDPPASPPTREPHPPRHDEPRRRGKSQFWEQTLAQLREMKVGDERAFRRNGALENFRNQLTGQFTYWRKRGDLPGRFRTRVRPELNCVQVMRTT